MKYLKTCCFCLSLRTGCFVIGGSGIFMALLGILMLVAAEFAADDPTFREFSTIFSKVTYGVEVFLLITLSILVIVGAYLENKILLMPWLGGVAVLAIIITISTFYMSILSIEDGVIAIAVAGFAMLIIEILLLLYVLWVVLSYYKELANSD